MHVILKASLAISYNAYNLLFFWYLLQILYEQPNRLSRDIKVVKEKKEKSVFTEKDFADFAKAYKAKTVKKK